MRGFKLGKLYRGYSTMRRLTVRDISSEEDYKDGGD